MMEALDYPGNKICCALVLQVNKYLDNKIDNASNMSFTNTHIDGQNGA